MFNSKTDMNHNNCTVISKLPHRDEHQLLYGDKINILMSAQPTANT